MGIGCLIYVGGDRNGLVIGPNNSVVIKKDLRKLIEFNGTDEFVQ